MPKSYVTAIIDLHDVPECLLVQNCPTPSGLPIPVANKIQDAMQYKDRSPSGLMMFGAYYDVSASARPPVATDFLRRPYASPEWRWFWHANKIYGITAFMLNGLCGNMPVFLEDNFLMLEHKVSFGFVPYPASVLIYKSRPQGNPPLTGRLSCQWSVAQQRDSRPASLIPNPSGQLAELIAYIISLE